MSRKLSPKLLITGAPGSGKTTLIKRLTESLSRIRLVGFYTAEIKAHGRRQGFEIVSFDGRRRVLSHVNIKSPFKVGRYGVDVAGFETFFEQIDFQNPSNPLVVIDEIGKMECFSTKFVSTLTNILDSDRTLLATIALKGSGPIAAIKQRPDVKLLTLTPANREGLYFDILQTAARTYRLQAD